MRTWRALLSLSAKAGNRRRASIAQALLGSPALVLLDEPFNGLDAGGVDDMLALISTLNRDEGTPPNMVLAVESATADDKGRPQVLRHDLRDDIYPEEAAA